MDTFSQTGDQKFLAWCVCGEPANESNYSLIGDYICSDTDIKAVICRSGLNITENKQAYI